jgi:predicted Fe-Mo cluster-binding NifX family protein
VRSPAPLEHAGLAPVLQLSHAMRVAVPTWNGRVSPVFDVARHVLVVDIERGAVTRTSEQELGDGGRVEPLSALGVDVLICSAISWPLEAMLWVARIEVVSDICGPTDEIIDAYRSGGRTLAKFRSPGHSDLGHGGRSGVAETARQKEPGRPRRRRGAVAKS